MSMGIQVRGIDLDIPMLRFGPGKLTRILARNGFERGMKTGVRSLLFHRRDYADLKSALQGRGHAMRVNTADLLVGDAATFDFGTVPLDPGLFTGRLRTHPPARASRTYCLDWPRGSLQMALR